MMSVCHGNQSHFKTMSSCHLFDFFCVVIRDNEISPQGLTDSEQFLVIDLTMCIQSLASFFPSCCIGGIDEIYHVMLRREFSHHFQSIFTTEVYPMGNKI